MNVQIPAVVKVGIADVQLVKSPDRIRTSGLGSCVGLVLFDQDKKAGRPCPCYASRLLSFKRGGGELG